MMRRTYYNTDKRRKLTREALRQLRETRRLIDPSLLTEMRRLIARQASGQQGASGDIAVDRQKNVATVMKFLELKASDQALCRKIKDILSDMP